MRNTVQREKIFDVLSKTSQALSPEELLSECQKEISNMGIATIHREIKRLRDEEKLEEVKIPNDVIRFCLAKKHHHHHFKCEDCGKVFDIECNGLDVPLPKGFKRKSHEINIFGSCDKCTAEA